MNTENLFYVKREFFAGIALLLLVNILSFLNLSQNIFIVAFVTCLCLFFINDKEKLAALCYIFSTTAFFFVGADEGIISIYSAYAVLAIISISKGKIEFNKILIILCVFTIPILLSFINSDIGYHKGMVLMIYNVVIAFIFGVTVDFEKSKNTITSFLPLIAAIQIIIFFLVMVFNGSLNTYGATIREGLNHNALGIALAQLGTIIGVKCLVFESKNKIYYFVLAIALLAIFLTGSRNALLGFTVALIISYIYKQKLDNRFVSGVLKSIIFASIVILIASFLLPVFGYDPARYNYIDVYLSGGSNRTNLWTDLISIIYDNYNLLGYGPSHYCSAYIIFNYLGFRYVHTHNLVIEAWGELGLIGLTNFIFIIFFAFKNLIKTISFDKKYFLILALLVELIFNGIGESMFADIMLWLILGMAMGIKLHKSRM